MAKKITQIVEDQVQTWSRQSRNYRSESKREHYLPIITISREFGARGADLASKLAQKLGFEVWDKELLQAIAEDSKSDEKFLKSLDERRRRAIEDAVLGFVQNAGTNVSYMRSLIRIVKTIEAHGKSIIVGRGANYICTMESTLDIRVVSPFHERIRSYSRRHGISETEASRKIQQMDRDRADFIKYNFKCDVAEPTDYDLVVNSGVYNLDELCRIVLEAYEQKLGFEVNLKAL